MRWLMFLAAYLVVGSASAAQFLEEETMLAVRIGGVPHRLEAIVVKPDVRQRLPVALITHGSPRDAADRVRFSAKDMLGQARDLAARGYLTVAFLRRGFGKEGGRFVEGYECGRPDFFTALDTAATDIEGVARSVAERPDADPSHMIGVGVSVGGASMLAYAAHRPETLAAIINISGGTGSDRPNHNCDERQLVEVFGKLGARARAPTLWLYAANDQYFGPELVQRMHQAFTAAGGTADWRKLASVGTDGHSLFSNFDGKFLWLAALDTFLRQQALPTWDQKQIEPIASSLSTEAKRVLVRYLAAPTNKALSLSPAGVARYWSAADLTAARTNSLRECQKDSGEASCRLVLENFALATP